MGRPGRLLGLGLTLEELYRAVRMRVMVVPPVWDQMSGFQAGASGPSHLLQYAMTERVSLVVMDNVTHVIMVCACYLCNTCCRFGGSRSPGCWRVQDVRGLRSKCAHLGTRASIRQRLAGGSVLQARGQAEWLAYLVTPRSWPVSSGF